MQKRSHILLASTLLRERGGFGPRRYELAFLLGSVQPDCNPLTHLRGFWDTRTCKGHHFSASRRTIDCGIRHLQASRRWGIRQYYLLGKLTHYLADAFTLPHNETFSHGLLSHHRYEAQMRRLLAEHLRKRTAPQNTPCRNVSAAIAALHRQYLASAAGLQTDIHYILQAVELLLDSCLPASRVSACA